jgi:hypothetical protein
MSSHDYVIANDTGANVRADLNLALLAIQSQNSGSSEPSTTYAYQFWADTSGTPTLKMRNAANNAWISILILSTGAPLSSELSGDSSPALGGFLDANGNYIQMQKGGDITSASPTVIDTDGDYFICTGTAGFSAMTVAADRHFFLEFAGALIMTHGAGTLDLPGGANITTVAGDVGEFVSTASNVVTCVNYTKVDGSALTGKLDATPDTDHTANGAQTNTLNAGYSSTIMDLVYLNANGKWLEADADATGTSINLLGIALEAKTDGQAMNVALSGSFVRDDTWNWTIGVPLYVSGSIGEITATKPSGSGDVVRTAGYAVTADVIFFNPSSDYVTLA